MPSNNPQTVLVIGASRSLGLGLAQEYLKRVCHVIATVRDKNKHTALHDLQKSHEQMLEIESIDITVLADISSLRNKLSERKFDVLFINAGVANDPKETIGNISNEEFIRIMNTNALSPMQVVEALADSVLPAGTIAVMSSGLASVTNNTSGSWEVYRASKASLNTLGRLY